MATCADSRPSDTLTEVEARSATWRGRKESEVIYGGQRILPGDQYLPPVAYKRTLPPLRR
ncbi:hypothetical protein ACP4OV_028155 [Aristida adscensionis]